MKKLLALLLALTVAIGLCACGSATADDSSTDGDTTEPVVLKVAATPVPHAEILAQVKDELAEQGIDLQVKEYNDYVMPNTAVEEGEEDANFFQHQPYLDNFNEENGTHLVSVAAIHYEPMGIYAGKTTSIDALPEGATIAIPNDPTNEGRALLLLQAQGLIEVDEAAGLEATPNDITSNPKNIQFMELESAMLANTVEEVDLSVINSNFAMAAGFDPVADSLASEDAIAEDSATYANVIVVKEGNEDNAAVQALIKALQSDKVRDFINETYKGAVVPVF